MWLVVAEKSKGDRRVAYFSAVLGTLLVIFGQDAKKDGISDVQASKKSDEETEGLHIGVKFKLH